MSSRVFRKLVAECIEPLRWFSWAVVRYGGFGHQWFDWSRWCLCCFWFGHHGDDLRHGPHFRCAFQPGGECCVCECWAFSLGRVLPYALSQCVGAGFAATVLFGILGDIGGMGTTSFEMSWVAAAAVEFLFTFMLMFVITAVATDARAGVRWRVCDWWNGGHGCFGWWTTDRGIHESRAFAWARTRGWTNRAVGLVYGRAHPGCCRGCEGLSMGWACHLKKTQARVLLRGGCGPSAHILLTTYSSQVGNTNCLRYSRTRCPTGDRPPMWLHR